MICSFEDDFSSLDHDICVIGSGPIGLALALTAAKRGMKVLILESGLRDPDDFHIALGRATSCPSTHAPLNDANCRALGGTSLWWGGRCIPLDPIDFEPRAGFRESTWPISYEDVARHYAEAATFFECGGGGNFSISSHWKNLTGLRADQVERWCIPNMAAVHRHVLEQSPNIHIVLDATVTDLELSGELPELLHCPSVTVSSKEQKKRIAVRKIILACGGVQTPRLLLAVQRRHTELGFEDGSSLGSYYMGHVFGKIADIVLNDPKDALALDFFVDGNRHARRRFTFERETMLRNSLPNISFALGNPKISDPCHRSGVLSLIWLALASPIGKRLLPNALLTIYVGKERPYAAHIGNVIRTLIPTMTAGFKIYRDKYIRKPGMPAIFLWNKGGRYSVHFHAEQMPDAENRITLSDELDALGTPRVNIAFRYTRQDADNVVRAHENLDRLLQEHKIGRLEFSGNREELIQHVLDQAKDGLHEIGATRMSLHPESGVVDVNCRVHGMSNLYVASTSVMPSSGNANPTFVGTSLAIRLAHHLADMHQARPKNS